MDRFLIRALIAASGLWVADGLIDGISFDSGAWLLVTTLVLGILNAVVRPLAIILTLPITLITLGLFLLVLNAGMLALAGWMLSGFHVMGFWPAFWGDRSRGERISARLWSADGRYTRNWVGPAR